MTIPRETLFKPGDEVGSLPWRRNVCKGTKPRVNHLLDLIKAKEKWTGNVYTKPICAWVIIVSGYQIIRVAIFSGVAISGSTSQFSFVRSNSY